MGGMNVIFVRMTDKNLLQFLTMTDSYQEEIIHLQAVLFTPQRGSNTVKNWNMKY